MNKECTTAVIIIPGLGDKVWEMKLGTWLWPAWGLLPVIESAKWGDVSETYQEKYIRLEKCLMEIVNVYPRVEIIGCSAGGSLAGNLFANHSDQISLFTNNCGRMKVGETTGYRSFAAKTKRSKSFAESVQQFEAIEWKPEQCKKILNFQAFYDELVPRNFIEGADNRVLPMIEHGAAIWMGLMCYPRFRRGK